MVGTRGNVSTEVRTFTIDSLARSLHAQVPRRRAMGMIAAALATGAMGVARNSKPAQARKKRGNRRVKKSASTAGTRRGTSIPPNCIYVCCDGTCDSWKMCLKCVKWPKPTTTTTLAS